MSDPKSMCFKLIMPAAVTRSGCHWQPTLGGIERADKGVDSEVDEHQRELQLPDFGWTLLK